MKFRDLVFILVLVGAAVFFLFRAVRDDGSGNERQSGRGDQVVSRRAMGEDGKEEGDQVARSDRKARNRSRVITTESGLQYEVIQEGSGESPGPESKVEVHYEGSLADGTIFDSSRERGESATFPLNAVIKGWSEGLQLMKPGAIYRFVIPPELAYGEEGGGDAIPPSSTLTFEVELISVKEP